LDPYAVRFSPDDLALIERRRKDYLEGKFDLFYGGFENLAQSRGLVPVWIDFIGIYFLDREGKLYSGDLLSEDPAIEVPESRSLIAVLMMAAKVNTIDLTHAVPERPTGAIECPECNGRGRIVWPNSRNTSTGKPGELHCQNCGTLGWYHADAPPRS